MGMVVLPKEVDEAIKKLRRDGMTDFFIIGRAFQGDIESATEPMQVIMRYIRNNTGDWDEEHEKGYTHIMQALVNGYEVEQTPEEKAIQWAVRNEVIARGKSAHDVVMAIKRILNEGSENDG